MVVCGACFADVVQPARELGVVGLDEAMFERVGAEQVQSGATWTCDAAVPTLRFALTSTYGFGRQRRMDTFKSEAHAGADTDGVLKTAAPSINQIFPPVSSWLPLKNTNGGMDDDAERIWRDAARAVLVAGASCFTIERHALPAGAEAFHYKALSAPDARGDAGSPIDFDACAACHAGFVRTLGPVLSTRFVQFTVVADGSRTCDLGASFRRHQELLNKIISASGMRDVGLFEKYIRERWVLSMCPGANLDGIGGLRWYGVGPEFVCCPECYLDVVK
jgi:hypothetical protein